ncbi:hypothetical protein BC939DRAFT_60983 [Gamsiella multidivaricata]|uniref:uncharacterized protein n=1 Tax=Gamsiella multidivaricata TaxID=101098 RepID=UPI0022201275|nr:uncharacterized protein BC939DRAFT_60983 [Gamsiella multidivaricata]KAI7828590.1 hypothetical protein BC939DRAFT_60983 [Gamsiella multidivaricata]
MTMIAVSFTFPFLSFMYIRALKLSLEYHCFEKDLEDTFCHAALDTLFSLYFPKKGKYVLDWANKETEGPKERRKNGYKPDAIISRGCREIAFVEVKPLKEGHHARMFLEDH